MKVIRFKLILFTNLFPFLCSRLSFKKSDESESHFRSFALKKRAIRTKNQRAMNSLYQRIGAKAMANL